MSKDGVVVVVNGQEQILATFDRTNKAAVAAVADVLKRGAAWIQHGARLRTKNEKLKASIGIREKEGKLTQLIAPQGRKSIGGMVEYGIGAQSAKGGEKAVYPSPQGLKNWASRHGLNPFAVARMIQKRRGIAPKPFLHPAFVAELAAIQREADVAIGRVVTEANGKVPDSGTVAGTRGGI